LNEKQVFFAKQVKQVGL